MKLIDKNGKIFEKVSILDIFAVAVIVILVFFAMLKISGKDISEVSEGSETRRVRYVVECEGEKGIFQSVKVGDKVGEQKNYLPAEVIEVKTEPIYYDYLKDGKVMEDPLKEKGIITYEGNLPYQSQSLKLGKQEIRAGQKVFAESDCYRLEGIITHVEVEDNSK